LLRSQQGDKFDLRPLKFWGRALQPRKVFLSYRREDSAAAAGRLSDRLISELGDGNVFMDVDGVPLGADFVERLQQEVSGCDALLAVIGPRWLDIVDEAGDRRLDDPNDFVRVEIAAALQREIPVIPILLDGTKIPRIDRLPEDLKLLSRRNGLDVRQASFHSDVGRLIRELKATEAVTAKPSTVETDRTIQNTAQPEPDGPSKPHPVRLVGELKATGASTVEPSSSQIETDRAGRDTKSTGSAPDSLAHNENPEPAITNSVTRCIAGTLVGVLIGILCVACGSLFQKSIAPLFTRDLQTMTGITTFAIFIAGSIGFITLGRKLMNMEIFRASIISGCLATMLGGSIVGGIVVAKWIPDTPTILPMWAFATFVIQGLVLRLRQRTV
jgi:hypothetical protein